ncbi:MAG: FmdB family transcriptional regulator [Propionibacteriales bacterium]|nr:FmdB family transcriptional regulator [Propionibacteriales bacterium]
MPTYQYACTECAHRLEVHQSFTDDALTECPVCDGRLRKVFNAVGVVFKGSGFYKTDSRAESKAAKTAAANGADKGSAKETAGASADKRSSTDKGSSSDKSSSDKGTSTGAKSDTKASDPAA